MSIKSLDRIDRHILTELDRNARRPTSEIARAVRLGRDIVEYRLDRLKGEGVLKKTMVLIDPYRLNLMVFKCYLKLRSDSDARRKLVTWLVAHQRVYWVAETFGTYDLVFSSFARTPIDFDQVQSDLLVRFAHLVLRHEVAVVVDLWSFPRRHLLTATSKHESVYYGGQFGDYKLDPIEQGILTLLSDDARLSLVELAERLSSTPIVVAHRLEKLSASGLVIGYRTQLNLSLLGLSYLKIQLELEDYSPQTEKAVRTSADRELNIIYLIRQLGSCRLELETEEAGVVLENSVLQRLSNNLGSKLRSANVLIIHQDHYHRLPANL